MDDKRTIKGWITIRGQHIPLLEGESNRQAIKKFLDKKGITRERYIRNWKKKEVENTLDYYDKVSKEYEDIRNEKAKLPTGAYYNFDTRIAPSSKYTEDEKKQIKKSLDKVKDFEAGKKGTLEFIDKYSHIKFNDDGSRSLVFNKQEARTAVQKEVNKHYNTLQNKVEKKIGKITNIEHLGGDDYHFKGEKGECSVEVIFAGGYNIQRLHTRWVVKK